MERLTGPRLARAIRAGALRVLARSEHLNAINVFPVPDADTGSNLAATLAAAAERVRPCPGVPVAEVAGAAAEAALEGARGNSGAVFAQFLHGLAEGLRDRAAVTGRELAAAARCGAAAAERALHPPREGTIVTVLREWAAALEEHAARVEDIRVLLERALDRARRALADTPRQLAVLRRHGVVDAGAQGFVDFLEGISALFASRRAADWRRADVAVERGPGPAVHVRVEGATAYRYCAEALLEGEALDPERVAAAVEGLGDSLVVAGGGRRVRVHLHTNRPQALFERLGGLGRPERTKVDDMLLEQLEAHTGRVALVSDSGCELPDERRNALRLFTVPLGVHFGADTFRDGVDLTPGQFYRLLRERAERPTTSQPPPARFRRLFAELLERYDAVLSIHLPARHSGTVRAARSAAERVDPHRIRVVDGGHVSVALGLVVEAAGEAIARGAGLDEAELAARDAARRTRVWAAIPDLEHAVRGGRVSPRMARIARRLGLVPIITFAEDGRIVRAGVAASRRGALGRLVRLAVAFAAGREVRALVAHAGSAELAGLLARRLARRFGLPGVETVEIGPALGAHAGPGTVAVAVQWLRSP